MKNLFFVFLVLCWSAKAEEAKNRIKAIVGTGIKGTSVQNAGTQALVQQNVGFVFGLSYDRKLDNKLVIGGQILTNSTVACSAGFDF